MATVKELIDEFCDLINQPREASYVGNTSPAARQYLALFRFISRQLLENGNNWPQLKRIYTFTISQGVSFYQLPGDFMRLLTGTQYGVTTQLPLSGPISNARVAFQTYGVAPITPYSSYQLNGAQGYIFNTVPYTQKSAGYFQIVPTGQNSTDENVIAYTSSNFVWPQNWAASTAYTAGQIRTGINNMYYCTVSGTSGATRLSATSGTIVDGTANWVVYYEPYPITADTDFFLLDDDLMIDGLRWAWYSSKKQDYLDLKAIWEDGVQSAIGRQNGPCYVNAGVDLNNQDLYPNVPIANWTGVGDV